MIANLSYFVSVAFIRNANFVSDKPVVTFVLLPFTGADKLTATTGSSKKQFAGAFFCVSVQSAARLGRAGSRKIARLAVEGVFCGAKGGCGGAEGVFVVRKGGGMSDSAG